MKILKIKIEDIRFNVFLLSENDKIVMVDITNINIIVLGIFSHKTKTVIIKLYLLTFMIMLLNYIKENPKSSKNLSAKIITNDIVTNQNYNNSIHLKI